MSVTPLKTVGHATTRIDARQRVTGKAVYTNDVQLPGMLFARVVRPPHAYTKILSVPTLEQKDFTIVRDGEFLGVLSEREEVAIAAAKKLREKAVWEKGKPVPADYHAWLKQNVAERQVAKEQPDAAARASATNPLPSFAQMLPECR